MIDFGRKGWEGNAREEGKTMDFFCFNLVLFTCIYVRLSLHVKLTS